MAISSRKPRLDTASPSVISAAMSAQTRAMRKTRTFYFCNRAMPIYEIHRRDLEEMSDEVVNLLVTALYFTWHITRDARYRRAAYYLRVTYLRRVASVMVIADAYLGGHLCYRAYAPN